MLSRASEVLIVPSANLNLSRLATDSSPAFGLMEGTGSPIKKIAARYFPPILALSPHPQTSHLLLVPIKGQDSTNKLGSYMRVLHLLSNTRNHPLLVDKHH